MFALSRESAPLPVVRFTYQSLADRRQTLLAVLDALPPSVALLRELSALDPTVLTDVQQATVAAAWTRMLGHVTAGQQHALAALAGPDDPNGPALDYDPVVPEIGAMLALTPNSAAKRVAQVRAMARLPRMLALLEAGRVQPMHLVVVADETRHLSDAAAALVDQRVAQRAERLAVGRTRSLARREAINADPDAAEREVENTRRGADVRARPSGPGAATLSFDGPAIDVALVMAFVERAASVLMAADPTLGLGAARAQALVRLVTGGAQHLDGCPTCGNVADQRARSSRKLRSRTQVIVHVSEATARGESNEPGSVEGYGPITATETRRYAWQTNSVWRRLVYNPLTGLATDLARATYRPPEALADLARAQAGGCSGPTCDHPAGGCETDHEKAWTDGGTTSLTNLGPLCPGWHDPKTHHGWTAERTPDGGTRWTSPLGRTYHRAPEDYRPPPAPPPEDDDPAS